MEREREVEREVSVEADPARVWEALTDEGLLGDWLADQARIEPVEGGEVYADCEDGERHGSVIRVEPGRELVFQWARDGEDPSFVAFTIRPAGTGTLIRVREVAPARVPGPLAWAPRLAALAAGPCSFALA